MPEIQLNGKTIATQTGTNEPVLKNNVVMESGFSIPSGVNIDNALSGATFPAGHVIQVKSNNFSTASSPIVATNTGAQTSNPGNLSSNQNKLGGGYRVYVELLSVTINISNALNNIVVFASVGCTSGSMANVGAFGFVINMPYSSNAGEAYDLGNYPWYSSESSLYATPYPPDWSGHIAINGSSGYVSSGIHNVKLFGYAYAEVSPNRSQEIRVRRAELTVMEIQA